MDIILTDESKSWLAMGFFTPTYRLYAEALAKQLHVHGAPHHFFAVERSGTWTHETMRKPSIVLDAMKVYPKKSLILMDVDCSVGGPIDGLPALNSPVDISCFLYVRTKKFGRHRQRASLSSRVVVVRPTDGARAFMVNWQDACAERPWMHGDEPNMMLALSRSSGTSFSPIPLSFSGRERRDALADAVVTHDSASSQSNEIGSWLSRFWGSSSSNQTRSTIKSLPHSDAER